MVESDFWKPTAELFGSLIEKPKMQEKFLKKPPPRYVYDVIMSTMAVTGFPKGLFTEEEMNPKFFDENPQNKLEILQKTIEITKVTLGENFEIKTTNLLKGDEPEKTNKFLQGFYRAATSGKDFAKIISKFFQYKEQKEKEKKEKEKKEKEKKEEEKKKGGKDEPKKDVVKEDTKPQKKESGKEVPAKETKPASNTNNNLTSANNVAVKTNTQARPQTPVKKPDRNPTGTKEIVEENTSNVKGAGKVPQGLISDKIKDEDDSDVREKSEVKPKIAASATSNLPNKVKNKDDDLSLGVPNPTSTGKIKIESRIGKFADLTNPGEVSKPSRTFSAADLESIKNYVQEISNNSNPIGKIIDFLDDDIESMNKELQSWIKEAKNYKDRFDDEVKRSEETLLPLQNELLELEETIRDEDMRIKSIKSRMIKNEQIIQNLINNVISIKNDK